MSHLNQKPAMRLKQCQHLIGFKLLFKISKYSHPLANPNEWIFLRMSKKQRSRRWKAYGRAKAVLSIDVDPGPNFYKGAPVPVSGICGVPADAPLDELIHGKRRYIQPRYLIWIMPPHVELTRITRYKVVMPIRITAHLETTIRRFDQIAPGY